MSILSDFALFFPNFCMHKSNFESLVPAIITLQPADINASAIAYPIPPLPPVINATFPFRSSEVCLVI